MCVWENVFDEEERMEEGVMGGGGGGSVCVCGRMRRDGGRHGEGEEARVFLHLFSSFYMYLFSLSLPSSFLPPTFHLPPSLPSR